MRLPCAFATIVVCVSSVDSIAQSARREFGPGDSVRVLADFAGFRLRGTTAGATVHFAPADSTFVIDFFDPTAKEYVVHFRKVPTVRKPPFVFRRTSTETVQHLSANGTTYTMVETHKVYVIGETLLSGTPLTTFGTEHGILIAPYKFHLSDHKLTGEATVGGFVGYRMTKAGFAITPMLAAGVGVVNVTTTDGNGQTSSENKPSLSAATGIITTFSRDSPFQVGLMIGWDWAGDSSQYEYEGKPWLAISFGAKLTQ